MPDVGYSSLITPKLPKDAPYKVYPRLAEHVPQAAEQPGPSWPPEVEGFLLPPSALMPPLPASGNRRTPLRAPSSL